MTSSTTSESQVQQFAIAKWFQVVAIIEAITWGLLLIGMVVKYGADIESATMVPGMLHGIAFIAYVVVAIVTAVKLRWSIGVTIAALAASLPPFFTVIFEVWAKKYGYLLAPDDRLAASTGEVVVGHTQSGEPVFGAPRSEVDGLAIASLVCSLVGLSIVGIVLGHLSTNRSRSVNRAPSGLAFAGLAIGYLWLVVQFVAILAFALAS